MENPDLTPILKKLITVTSLPLTSIETDFTIDSSGFGTSRFVKWFDHKVRQRKRLQDVGKGAFGVWR